jgi:short-subunit dehydrogenase
MSAAMSLDRYGPWAVITGGSDGIGEAFARQLGRAGINLVLVSRSQTKLSALAEAVHREFGVEVRTLALDLSEESAIDAIRCATQDVEVGLLVCNVGAVFGTGRFLRSELADIEKTMRLNNWSHATLSHLFGRSMLERGRGGIVLIGSMAGNAGGASTVLYGAGKAFAQIFAEGLWSEVKSKGIDVLYVVVGAVNTPRRQSLNIEDSPGQFVADPADVAREALEALPDGPVLVPQHLQDDFSYFSSAPRREAAEAMTAMLKGFPRKKAI